MQTLLTTCRCHIFTVVSSDYHWKTDKPRYWENQTHACSTLSPSSFPHLGHYQPPPAAKLRLTPPDSISGLCLLRSSAHPWAQPLMALVSLDFGFYKLHLLPCLFLWISISKNRTLPLNLDFWASALLPGFSFNVGAADHLSTRPETGRSHTLLHRIDPCQPIGRLGALGPGCHSRASSSCSSGL